MLTYQAIKEVHIGFAVLSVSLFVLRAYWSVTGSSRLGQRWVRILPHVIDTLLLVCGVALMCLLQAWPHQTPWLATKLLALILYIGLGTMAIKRGASPTKRLLYAVAALLVFVYIVGVAIQHHPASWFS